MYLKAGDYTHRINEAGVSVRRQAEKDGSDSVWAWRETWDISARLLNSSGVSSDLDASIAAVEAAYNTELSYIALLHDDGVTPTAHEIEVNDTLGGIRVVSPPSFGEYRGGEYVTYRTYRVSVECLRPVGTFTGRIYDHKEKVEIRHGGPSYGFLTPNVGDPVKQLLRQKDPWFATQSGTITGLGSYPTLPPPIWPTDQLKPVNEAADAARKVGKNNAGYILYPLTYRYEFGSVTALSGSPTTW